MIRCTREAGLLAEASISNQVHICDMMCEMQQKTGR